MFKFILLMLAIYTANGKIVPAPCLSNEQQCGGLGHCIPLAWTCCGGASNGCPPTQYCVDGGCCDFGKICIGRRDLEVNTENTEPTRTVEIEAPFMSPTIQIQPTILSSDPLPAFSTSTQSASVSASDKTSQSIVAASNTVPSGSNIVWNGRFIIPNRNPIDSTSSLGTTMTDTGSDTGSDPVPTSSSDDASPTLNPIEIFFPVLPDWIKWGRNKNRNP